MPGHDVGRGPAVFQFVGHEAHPRIDVIEEALVAGAAIYAGLLPGVSVDAALGCLRKKFGVRPGRPLVAAGQLLLRIGIQPLQIGAVEDLG